MRCYAKKKLQPLPYRSSYSILIFVDNTIPAEKGYSIKTCLVEQQRCYQPNQFTKFTIVGHKFETGSSDTFLKYI